LYFVGKIGTLTEDVLRSELGERWRGRVRTLNSQPEEPKSKDISEITPSNKNSRKVPYPLHMIGWQKYVGPYRGSIATSRAKVLDRPNRSVALGVVSLQPASPEVVVGFFGVEGMDRPRTLDPFG
jgi:hypothetical protein